MAISIPSPLIEFILLGPLDDRRQLQDSPILGDVWVEFGKRPDARLDLLIEPFRGQHAGRVAVAISKRLGAGGGKSDGREVSRNKAKIAYLHSLIVARLTFGEMLRVVAPMTRWWEKQRPKPTPTPAAEGPGGQKDAGAAAPAATPPSGLSQYDSTGLRTMLGNVVELAGRWHRKADPEADKKADKKTGAKAGKKADNKTGKEGRKNPSSLDRFVALTGLILWAGDAPDKGAARAASADEQIALILKRMNVERMARLLEAAAAEMMAEDRELPDSLVWQVSLNRRATPAIARSVPAVKADAAKTLFKVNCSDIAWAVLDSGIDGAHPCFRRPDGTSRVEASYDFYDFRRIVSVDNLLTELREHNAAALMETRGRLKNPPKNLREAGGYLKRLAEDADRGGPIQWNLVERFVQIKTGEEQRPPTSHGTHVAGIIGASREAAQKDAEEKGAGEGEVNEDFADGMCPDIRLYDFRVLGSDVEGTEFAVIAALQFIRHLNARRNHFTIHGANLSLSIPHHVRNYACGRTPVCEECERLVESGVVVVAAAGNHGYKSFETREGLYDSYAAFSITDPGNAEGVLTVGSTHRYSPHTFGVSFFSSRGPTGDGRLKPDLVAPGERIRAPFPGGLWDDHDGTSMAAPHVSGAAAMLMARYSELIGQPRRVKRILCDSATDLGRERSFQGHGMLDVLRAFQSI